MEKADAESQHATFVPPSLSEHLVWVYVQVVRENDMTVLRRDLTVSIYTDGQARRTARAKRGTYPPTSKRKPSGVTSVEARPPASCCASTTRKLLCFCRRVKAIVPHQCQTREQRRDLLSPTRTSWFRRLAAPSPLREEHRQISKSYACRPKRARKCARGSSADNDFFLTSNAIVSVMERRDGRKSQSRLWKLTNVDGTVGSSLGHVCELD